MLRIWFEWLELASECFEYLSNGSNLQPNASNPFQICIWMPRIPLELLKFAFEWFQFAFEMLRIPFEWLEFAFECFKSLSNDLNLHSNASNPFEWFKFGFECFESLLNCLNLHLNSSNPFRIAKTCIWMLQIPFEGFTFAFECFKFFLNG